MEDLKGEVAEEFSLSQSYPNPFNLTTTIRYSLPTAERVRLTVYDLQGREVAVLFLGQRQSAGWHEVMFDSTDLPSGLYFFRFEAGAISHTGKMILLE